MKNNYLKIWSILLGLLVSMTTQGQITSGVRGEQFQNHSFVLKSYQKKITNDPTFKNNNKYVYVGDTLLFGQPLYLTRVSGPTDIKVPILNYEQIDSSTAKVIINLPSMGYYGVYINDATQYVNNTNFGNIRVFKKYKTFKVTPNHIISNEPLKVTITGINTKLGRGATCAADSNCRVIGDYMYFAQSTMVLDNNDLLYYNGVQPYLIATYTQLNDKTVELTFNNGLNSWGYTHISNTANPFFSDDTISAYSETYLPIVITDLNSNEFNIQINLYPNPTTGIINLENVVNATLFNVLGEEILKTTKSQIDITEMPKGLYYLQATDAKNKLHSVKIVKE